MKASEHNPECQGHRWQGLQRSTAWSEPSMIRLLSYPWPWSAEQCNFGYLSPFIMPVSANFDITATGRSLNDHLDTNLLS